MPSSLCPATLQNVFFMWSVEEGTFPALSPDEGNRFSFMALNGNTQNDLRSVPLTGWRKASTIYWGPTILHMFLSFSVVSLFVDLLINPSRTPNPNRSAIGLRIWDLVFRFLVVPPFLGGLENFFY